MKFEFFNNIDYFGLKQTSNIDNLVWCLSIEGFEPELYVDLILIK
jgi:hypothetical protein